MGSNIEERYDAFLKACQEDDLETIEDLIFDRTFRIDVNRSLKDGANAIIIAAQEDKYQLVKLLLLNGADANSKIPNGWSVLMLAIRTGNYDTCKLLVDKGADINEKSPEGMSPLTLAAFCDNFEIVKLLVQKGANVNAAAEDGKTPLNQAKSKEIIIKKPDINKSTDKYIVSDNKIIYPFSNLKSVGNIAAKKIMEARGDTPFVDIYDAFSCSRSSSLLYSSFIVQKNSSISTRIFSFILYSFYLLSNKYLLS